MRRYERVVVAGVVAGVLMVSGCSRSQLAERVESGFLAEPVIAGTGKQAHAERNERMRRVLDGLLPDARDRLIREVMEGRSGFRERGVEREFWGCAVGDLMKRGRWELLREVLERISVDDIGMFAIEFVIASQDGVERLGVLCEAYARTRSEKVREGIATCFRRAFPREGNGVCDRMLVERCAAFLPCMGGRTLNMNYRYLPSADWSGPEGLLVEPE
jgi:hypothetical protein